MKGITAALVVFVSFTVSVPAHLLAESVPFKVGMILPLSGPVADYGQSIANCIELAEKDHPDKLNNIHFMYEDAGYDPKRAVAAFQKLIEHDRVDLIYTWGVAFCKALAPLAESKEIPLIAQCIDHHSTADKRFVIRFMNYTDEYLRVQTNYLRSQKLQRIGVILTNHPYLEEMFEALKRNVLPGQTVTLVERFHSYEMDLRPTVSKLKRAHFDVIGVFLYPGQVAQYYRQAKELGVSLPTFGTNLFESVSEIRLARGAMEGAVFANNPIKPEFAERYESLFKNTSQLGFGALGYEFAVTLGKLFNNVSPAITAAEIISSFRRIESEPGLAAGPYSFRESSISGRDFNFPIVIKAIEGENFEILSLNAAVDQQAGMKKR